MRGQVFFDGLTEDMAAILSVLMQSAGEADGTTMATPAKPRLSYRRSLISAIGACLVLSALWVTLGSLVLPIALKHDFLVIYTGARMAANGEYSRLHDRELMVQRMLEIERETSAPPVVRPHFYVALTRPLAALPIRTAFEVWIGIQITVLLACWLWSARTFGPDAMIWGALSAACGMGISHGQDCVLFLAIAIAGYELARRDRPFAAGAVWALVLTKPHLILLLFPAMLVSRRWRMAAGFATSGAALFGTSLALGGWEGMRNWIALLRNKDLERLNPSPEQVVSIQGILTNLHISSEVVALLSALTILGAAAWVIRRQPLWLWVSLALTASLFAAPHVYGYDLAIFLLPVWLVQAYSSSLLTKAAFAALATPLPFFIGLAGPPWLLATPLCLGFCLVALVLEARGALVPEHGSQLAHSTTSPVEA